MYDSIVETLDVIKDVSITVGGLVALVTLVTSAFEFRLRNRYNKAQDFAALRRKMLDSSVFLYHLEALKSDDPSLAQISPADRRSFLGFFEEVALMMNSGLVRPEVAQYMFGYYALLCSRSKNLWIGLDPESRYWILFWEFVRRMEDSKPGPDSEISAMRF